MTEEPAAPPPKDAATNVPGVRATPAVATPAPPPANIPWLALFAVLLGTFLSTLNTRLSSIGLADIRGAVHAGFDEGAWVTTSQSVAQMLICPLAIWLGHAYGARRVLIEAAVAFALIELIEPFSPNLHSLLALQFLGGLASGFFVPLTLTFVLRNMPPKYWTYGIALYAMNLEVSLNVSASIEGWYTDNLSWHWIYWQNVPLAIGMAICMALGTKPDAPNPQKPTPDYFGFASGGIGLALIYAALDQGNRLDWQNSPIVWALSISGGVLLIGFLIHEARAPQPGVNLRSVMEAPLPRLLLLVSFMRFTVLSGAFVVPLFLEVVRGFRAIEVGETLLWIALPQLLLCLMAGYILRRVDSRLVASVGFMFICAACLLVAHTLTPEWGSDQFIPSQLLQAVGQSLALSGILFFAVLHLRPQSALTFAAAIQVVRLLGGEVGTAFTVTFVRKRSQIASNLIGQHLQIGDSNVIDRVQRYAEATAPAGDAPDAFTRGIAVLHTVVHSQSIMQGIVDSFVVIAAATAFVLILLVTRRAAPPHPAGHIPLFAPRAREGGR